MNSDDIVSLTGLSTSYEYRELEKLPSDAVKKYVERTRELFAPIAKSFDDGKNTEWLIRSYLSLKYILASTVLGTSAQHAEGQNLKVVMPYLKYYTMLNCCRAFIFTLPCVDWKDEKSIQMTHSNIINTGSDRLKRLNDFECSKHKKRLEAGQNQREFFSYSFPATGLSIFGDDLIALDDAIETARLFADLTQLNLSCLEAAIMKHGKPPYSIVEQDVLWLLMRYDTKLGELIDDDDYQRVGYFLRKYRHPSELASLATAGLVEDFLGAWQSESDTNEFYDPDRDWCLLLSL
jgi:hypothetical protein